MRIVVATANAHKVREIAAALASLDVELLPVTLLEPDFISPPEDADSFQGNALIKAWAAHEACGLPALADDSGLVVDALKGAPGVYSARYAGENASDSDNNFKLLSELSTIPERQRSARFVSVIALVGLDTYNPALPREIIIEGSCEGSIAFEAKGHEGFGYDPLFKPVETPGKRMAELSMDEKNQISHRGKALKELSLQLIELL